MLLRDRIDAGRQLAVALEGHTFRDPVVVALPRGGVPVAEQVAWAIDAPLDVLVSQKVRAPGQPEWAIGAVAEEGIVVRNDDALATLRLSVDGFLARADHVRSEVDRRAVRYRSGQAPEQLHGRDVVLVDDGLATGATAEAAALALRRRSPRRLLLAVPVASIEALERLRRVVDEVTYLEAPEPFEAVGCWYEHFDPTSEAEVASILAGSFGAGLARSRRSRPPGSWRW